MTKDAFKERERALEEEFFYRADQKSLDALKKELTTKQERDRLASATGLTDEGVLTDLVKQGISAEAVTAVSLVPLVMVAWADDEVQEKERPLVLKAAAEQGLAEGSVAKKLLEHWLTIKPNSQLYASWKKYCKLAIDKMEDDTLTKMRDDLIHRCRAIARASGGTLGIGKVSDEEKRVIAEIAETLTRE